MGFRVRLWVHMLSQVWLFATPWTVALQAPLSMVILQARILEWVAMASSRGSSQARDQTQASHIAGRFFTNWTTREAQEYWSRYPIPFPGDLPDPGTEPESPALQADSIPAELPRKPVQSLCLRGNDLFSLPPIFQGHPCLCNCCFIFYLPPSISYHESRHQVCFLIYESSNTQWIMSVT